MKEKQIRNVNSRRASLDLQLGLQLLKQLTPFFKHQQSKGKSA